MADRLREEDIAFLGTFKRLGQYIMETPQGGTLCGRLKAYHDIVIASYEYFAKVDGLGSVAPTQPRRKLSDDQAFVEDHVAKLIMKKDRELLGILQSLGLREKHKDVCKIYARIVIGHASESNIDSLVIALQTLGIDSPPCG